MALSRKALGGLSAALIVGVVAAGVYWRTRPAEDAAAQDAEPAENEAVVQSVQEQFSTEVPQPVVGAAAVRDTFWVSFDARGVSEAMRQSTVQARVAGIVTAVAVEENQSVGEGRLLVQIDTAEYGLEVAARAAAVRKAEVDFKARTLMDEELDEEARAERARLARSVTGLDQAEAEHRRAVLNLEKTTVRAPFAGRVADLKVVAGQHVAQGDELLTVLEISPIKVQFQVLGTQVPHLAEGRNASMVFSALPDTTFVGRIATINPMVDRETGTARVTVYLPNHDGRIKPGMYAEGTLRAQHYAGRLIVPRQAVLEKRRRTMLFVLEEGRAKWRYINIGLQNKDFYELVREGSEDGWVEPGEIVLVDGHYYLPHDAAVTLVEDVAAADGRPTR